MTTTIEQAQKLQDIAQGAYETIKGLVVALRAANGAGDPHKIDAAFEAIHQHPLSVEVRSDWCGVNAPFERAEYRILISWGGPAVQVTGKLGQYNEPATAVLQAQDWFVEWREWVPSEAGADDILIEYSRSFYFDE